LTFPFHVTIIDSSGNQLLAEIVQNSSNGNITIQDLPAETIKVFITGQE
jgi:DNA-binding FadR family transcriptional regulator